MEINSNRNEGIPKRHVAVFVFPFSSHPPLLLTLVRMLASAAPNVIFSFFGTAKSNQALFSDQKYNNIRPYDVSDGIPKDYVFMGKPQEDINLFLAVAEEEFRKGVKVVEKDIGLKIGCLLVDSFFWFLADMADEMSIPWVSFWTAGANSLSAHFYTDLIRQKYDEIKGTVGPDDEIADLIPGLKTVRISDLPGEVVLGNLESPFSTMLHKMARSLPRATAVPINSFDELDPELNKNLSSQFNNFLNIGPFNLISKENSLSKVDEFSCLSWLDNQKPRSVAYICFGTFFKPPPHELVELAEALEETQTSFLWSIKSDSNKHFPKGFLERICANGTGKVVPWAPQIQVLEHSAIGVFITHGGWNSMLESLGVGVPMICRPFVGDQQLNTWMIERVWGIGAKIEGGRFTKHGTACALKQFLSSNELSIGRKKRIEALKELAHKAVEPNGGSTKNFKTLVDMITSATL
uniref:kaempferol 3-O-beta-D-galactosyltransferase-like n=1 Tax=Erigeron canadensis TaxID=72917 RepID=UPI001CB9341A|nr:kaempferol 3-O-beta-D-galactosyltransferase-like [Erigeron canadensis]